MRLFVGLDITEGIRRRVANYMDGLMKKYPDVKWVNPEMLHVTLKFIGENSQLEEIRHLLANVQVSPLEMTFKGTGFFTPRAPRVFWVGVHASHSLAELALQVDHTLASLNISRETLAFHPHLTLAREGSGRPQGGAEDRGKGRMHSLYEHVRKLDPPEFGKMTCRRFLLYKSVITHSGPIYTPIEHYDLRKEHTGIILPS